MDREPFIGLWDMYCGWVHSELLLQTDNTYNHSLWGGVQSHWGVWSVVVQNEQPFLVLELRGAQPPAYPGLLGLVSMVWPSTESWAVTAVQPNDVYFYHARMTRRSFAGLPAASAMGMPFFSPVPPPIPPPILVPPQIAAPAQPSAKAAPEPAASNPPQPPTINLPPPEYSAPAPSPTPDGHQSSVMSQWLDSVKAAQAFHLQMMQNSMESSRNMNSMLQDQFNQNFATRAAQIKTMEQNTQAQAHAFIADFVQK